MNIPTKEILKIISFLFCFLLFALFFYKQPFLALSTLFVLFVYVVTKRLLVHGMRVAAKKASFISFAIVTPIALCVLLGGLIYGEYFTRSFTRDFTSEWKKFARSHCVVGEPTLAGYFVVRLLSPENSCCFETVKEYNDAGAIPFDGETCPQGYVMTPWIPMCSGLPACYPEDAKELMPKSQIESYQSDDFDTSGFRYQ